MIEGDKKDEDMKRLKPNESREVENYQELISLARLLETKDKSKSSDARDFANSSRFNFTRDPRLMEKQQWAQKQSFIEEIDLSEDHSTTRGAERFGLPDPSHEKTSKLPGPQNNILSSLSQESAEDAKNQVKPGKTGSEYTKLDQGKYSKTLSNFRERSRQFQNNQQKDSLDSLSQFTESTKKIPATISQKNDDLSPFTAIPIHSTNEILIKRKEPTKYPLIRFLLNKVSGKRTLEIEFDKKTKNYYAKNNEEFKRMMLEEYREIISFVSKIVKMDPHDFLIYSIVSREFVQKFNGGRPCILIGPQYVKNEVRIEFIITPGCDQVGMINVSRDGNKLNIVGGETQAQVDEAFEKMKIKILEVLKLMEFGTDPDGHISKVIIKKENFFDYSDNSKNEKDKNPQISIIRENTREILGTECYDLAMAAHEKIFSENGLVTSNSNAKTTKSHSGNYERISRDKSPVEYANFITNVLC